MSRNSTFFRNTRFCPSCHRFSLKLRNLIYRKCDVSCKKPYDFRTKFKNIQLNFAQIICIKSFHSFIQVLSLAKQCTACTSISGIYWRKELPIKPFVSVLLYKFNTQTIHQTFCLSIHLKVLSSEMDQEKVVRALLHLLAMRIL